MEEREKVLVPVKKLVKKQEQPMEANYEENTIYSRLAEIPTRWRVY